MGPWRWTGPNECLRPAQAEETVSAGRPIVSFFTAPFRPMLNCIAKLIYNYCPKRFPQTWQKAMSSTSSSSSRTPTSIRSLLRVYTTKILLGFFTSIDTDRFIASWRLTFAIPLDPHEYRPRRSHLSEGDPWQYHRRCSQRPHVSYTQCDQEDLHS